VIILIALGAVSLLAVAATLRTVIVDGRRRLPVR
jgi:hypothetical protein